MRIAVNLRKFQPGEVGGIENYVRHVVGGVASDAGHALTIFVQDIAVEAVREFAPRAALRVVPHRACGLSIGAELDDSAHDVLLCPQMGLDPIEPGLPSVAMVPDLAHRATAESFDPAARSEREDLVAATVANADLIVTLSNYSREALVDAYRLDPRRVVVTYCGVGVEFLSAPPAVSPAFAELKAPDDYLYFPANFWHHKNHANLLAALALVKDSHPRVQLLLTGAPATGAERVSELISALGLANNVRILGYLPTEVVAALMRQARALVFPTLFEGFGIPPLEAFNVGTPVLSSGAAGNLEVVGDAALLVDPGDPQSIAEGIDRLLVDGDLRDELVRRGRERAALFSWERTVEIVESSLRQTASASTTVSGRRTPVREPTRVSLVTPVTGSPQLLAETIDSVLAQEYPYVDYLVLGTGSAGVLAAYSHRLRWCSRPHGGEVEAINEGYEETQGDLFAFLLPGDLYLPDALWRAVAHYDADPTVAVVFGQVGDRYGAPLGRGEGTVFDEERIQRPIFPSAAFVTRDAFARAGMLDPGDRAAGTERLWQRIAHCGGLFRYAPRRFAVARAHDPMG